jgi:hypothetical protein
MKKLSLLFMAFVMGIFILSSCSNDDDLTQAPTITVTPGEDTVKVNIGDMVNYQANWSCPDPILSAKISYKAGASQEIILDTTLPAETKSFSYNLNVEVTDNIPVGTTIQFDFFGNSKDNSTIVTKYIYVESGVAAYDSVVLQAQADGPVSADENLTFYSTNLNERYTLNQAQEDDNAANIDIVFTHHSVFRTNDELAFKSPNLDSLYTMWHEFPAFDPPYEYNLANKNQTYFKKVTVENWDELTYEDINDIVGEIGTDALIRGIYVDDYIAFQTQAGKKGILKVTNTEINHNPYNDTFITFDVKVQR